MTDHVKTDVATSGVAVKGLATVAMLKVNFDAGRDHLAMFEPFVRDAAATFPSEDMDTKEVTASVVSRHGLKLPENAMRTLLGRLVRQGYLKREGGRYFRTDKALSSEDVLRARQQAEGRQRSLAMALIESAKARGVKVDTPEDALALIMSFMEAYHVRLAFDEPPDFDGTHDEHTAKSPQHIATALFLSNVINGHGELSHVVQEMLEGFVLQNTLLLRDIAQAGREFQDLEVFLDSQILFGALGLRGPASETAILELLELLQKTGAVVNAFEPTIQEMRRVLMVYEEKVGTAKGREELYPSDLTRHFLTQGFTPADVKERAALIERGLHSLGIDILALPNHVPEWTTNEEGLAKSLVDESGREDQPRVVHDVDCVAAVLTYRKGRTQGTLDTCGAIFVTSSGMTVSRTRDWYRQQGGQGMPPIIHELSLSNYAWLKRPASAAKLKVHELVALCAAALRPSREVWERFVRHLRDLERSGHISSDEVAAVVASELTQNALAEVEVEEDSDAASLSEVVERVRREYRAEADQAVNVANEAAEARSAELEDLRRHVKSRARSVARFVSLLVTALLGLSLVAGTTISVVDAVSGDTPSLIAALLALVPLAVLGLVGVISGFHLVAGREKLQAWLVSNLEAWMLHGQTMPNESTGEAGTE